MKKCKNCQVTILDHTMVCPLCHSVLDTDTQNVEQEKEQDYVPGMYPDVKEAARRLNFVVKLYTFLAIVIEAGLIVINDKMYAGTWWSAISGIAILYLFMTLRYSIQKNSGYRRVILMQVIGGVFLTIAVDFIVGYRGWSVNYVVPSAILLIDLAIIILMLVNMNNWQSYILLQMMTLLLSIIILILWRVHIITHPMMTIVAAAISAILFVGTLIFGDRRAKNELKRRFHM